MKLNLLKIWDGLVGGRVDFSLQSFRINSIADSPSLDLATMTAPTIASWILGLLLGLMTLLFIFRIVLTWRPQADLNKLPFNLIAWPTEPFLIPVRKIIPPIGGVDISPIIWVGIVSLLRELLIGQQGLLKMLA